MGSYGIGVKKWVRSEEVAKRCKWRANQITRSNIEQFATVTWLGHARRIWSTGAARRLPRCRVMEGGLEGAGGDETWAGSNRWIRRFMVDWWTREPGGAPKGTRAGPRPSVHYIHHSPDWWPVLGTRDYSMFGSESELAMN